MATALMVVPGSSSLLTHATDVAPPGNGAAADAPTIALGARWSIFDSAPGHLASTPMPGGFDTVGADGRTVKHIAVSMIGNADVATANSVNRTVFSDDGGQTFTSTRFTPWTGMNYARLADGRLMAIAFIPTNDSGPNKDANGNAVYNPVKLQEYTSSDEGKTWQESHPVVTPPPGIHFGMNRGMRINRGIMQLQDGTILVAAYTNYGPDTNPMRTILLQSTDGGKSFSVRSTVMFTFSYYDEDLGKQVTVRSDELSVAFTTDNRMVAVSRSDVYGGPFQDGKMLTTFSDDAGKTWAPPQLLKGPGGRPVQGINPTLVMQPNGMLLLSTGRPDNRLYVNTDGTGRVFDVEQKVFSNPPPGKVTVPPGLFGSGGNTGLLNVGANRSMFFYDTCITNGWCKPYNEQYSDHAVYVNALTPGTGKIDVMTQLLDKVATVTGDFAPPNPKFPEQRPAGAFDGSANPKAASVLQAPPGQRPVMRIKLDRPYTMDKIGLMLGNGQPLNATVQVSADGKAWGKPVIQAKETRDHAMRYTTFAPKKVQYIQITGDADTATPVTEMELYSSDVDTFENDPVFGIPRGFTDAENATVTDVRLATASPEMGGYHSQRSLRLYDRYTNEIAKITKVAPDTGHQTVSFQTAVTYPYDGVFFDIKGHSAGKLTTRYHFWINGPATKTPHLLAYDGHKWNLIATLHQTFPLGVWHSIKVDATTTSATVTVDDETFTTGITWQSADTLCGTGFSSAGMAARNTETFIDDLQIDQH